MKKLIGIAALLIAFGMLLMLLVSSRLIALMIIGLLILIGYGCYGNC